MDSGFASEWPFLAVWAFFCFGALCRGGFMHWLGRRVRRFDAGHRGLADRPAVARAQVLVERYGAPAVTLAHLTVGVQSAVMIASGLLLMPLRRFVPALVIGAAIWATIYTTVGMSVVYAALGELHWGWLLVALGAVALVLAGRRLATLLFGSGGRTSTGSQTGGDVVVPAGGRGLRRAGRRGRLD